MTRNDPSPGCHDLAFEHPLVLDDPAEVALEDYAAVLTRAPRAEAWRREESLAIAGVHVCGAAAPPTPAAQADIEAFARRASAGP